MRACASLSVKLAPILSERAEQVKPGGLDVSGGLWHDRLAE
jgi:hypothetical protein